MGPVIHRAAAAIIALAFLLPGCQMVSSERLASIETQNRVLGEQNQAQLQEIENLKAHNRTIENQLIQAEEELAELDQRLGVDRKQIANFQRERRTLRGKVESLVEGARSGEPPADHRHGERKRLEDLSLRHDWLAFDPATGVSRFDTDLLFDSGEAELRTEARIKLDELAHFLKSPAASELRVMVVGHTDSQQIAKRPVREKYPDNWHLSAARALAVADYLRHKGVREEQLGIAGYGKQQLLTAEKDHEDRQLNRRVEIFVMGPETPVVGWTETTPSIY